MGVVRSLLEKCEVFDRVGSCKENVRRNVRYLIDLGVCLEKCKVFDRVGSCKENCRRNVRYLIELRAVRSLFGELGGIR